MKRKLLSLLLVLCLCAALCGTASAAWLADLPETAWSYPYASALVDAGIMETDEDFCFLPDVATSRGAFVLALWRAFGSPEPAQLYERFADVDRYSEYFDADEWANSSGITTGISDTQFGADYDLTREQAFTFLYRAMRYTDQAPAYGSGHEQLRQISEFSDYGQISAWAADPIQLLMDIGIVTGSSSGELWPKMSLNNAATATILYKAMVYMGLLAAG